MQTSQVSILSVFTSTLWLTCAAAGVAGLLLRYPRPPQLVKAISPVNAEILNVQVIQERASPSPAQAVQSRVQIPSPPDLSPPIAVANPSILFPQQITEPPNVSRIQPSKINLPSVQHLVFGQDEGQQPAPEYPREAVIARQQGTVVVEFVLDADGHVQSVQATSPCPFPLLNQAAMRTIQEQWTFPPGKARRCDVSIVFELKQN